MRPRPTFLFVVFLLAVSCLLLPPRAVGATNVWFSPQGSGNIGSREKPMRYLPDYIKWDLIGGDRNQDREVILHFLPGIYFIPPINTQTVYPSDWKITIRGEGARPEDTVLTLVPNYPEGASEGGGGWVNVIDLGRNAEYLRRFVLENITIDGNWTGQTNYNHRAYLRGYKNSPVYASARTGRIRNVIVRNYGAHGLMPQRSGDLAAGVEVFPVHIFTQDEGQAPEDGDAYPWVVENCEVTGFHGVYGGYSSSLMAVVKIDPAKTSPGDDPARRLVWFHGNQVRGNADGLGVIGLGAAGLVPTMTGRVTWSDNVVLNGLGFNTDTGVLRWLDFTNCLMLDVPALGYFGTPNSGEPFHRDYNISGNAVRLVGNVAGHDYRNFRWVQDASGKFSARADSDLVLGRLQTSRATGLMIGGIAKDIHFTGNWFTARSADQFNRLSTLLPREPGFRLVNRLPAKDAEQPEAPSVRRQDALNVNLTGNRWSEVPFDFARLRSLAGDRVARLTEGSSPLMDQRLPLAKTDGFAPTGTVRRVVMLFTNAPVSQGRNPERRLIGAIEVVCGTPSRAETGGRFSVPVRAAIQPTPTSGWVGTKPLPNRQICLEVLPGSRHPHKLLLAKTDENGVATFTFDVKPDAQGVDFFRAWADGGQGVREQWDEYQDSWATAQYVHGQTVGILVDIDVADAGNQVPGQLRLVRTGSVAKPLTVKFDLGAGAYAAELGRDFLLTRVSSKRGPGGGKSNSLQAGSGLEFAAGQREIQLQVEALPKTARSARLVNLQVQPGDGYAVGDPPAGEIVIYVPPQ